MPDVTPLEKAANALDEWRDEFRDEWRDLPVDDSAPWPNQEEQRTHNEIAAFFRPFHNRTDAILKTILEQHVAEPLRAHLASEPWRGNAHAAGLDPRLASLLPLEAKWLFDCLDADFLDYVIGGIRESVRVPEATRSQVYVLLLASALETPVSPIASWYLKRAIRLLLLGLHPECIAICRAVLDAALRFRFGDQDLERVGTRKSGGRPSNPEYTLSDRCWGGRRLVRDPEIWKDADTIRLNGNSVLHPDPEDFGRVTGDGLDATKYVLALARVLRALFPKAGA